MNRSRTITLGVAGLAFVLVCQQAWAGVPVTAESLLQLLVFALPLAAIYAISASGLVVVYTTTGIFNFAQGAIGMLMAFLYWELRVNRGWPTALALVVVVLVLAPALGVLLDTLVMRKLRDSTLVAQLLVTVGLMLAFMGMAASVWDPNLGRAMPELVSGNAFSIAGVNITWHRFITFLVAIALAVVLRFVLYRTRLGVTMRAVVDNRDLAGLNGARPGAVSSVAWAIGCSTAAIAGILIAPSIGANIEGLTLLIINAFAAAIVGRLRSLPLTYLGALILGVLIALSQTFLSFGGRWAQLPFAIPTIMLFVALLALPQARLQLGRISAVHRTERLSSVQGTAVGMLALVVIMAVASGFLDATNTNRMILAMTTALLMLSLVPLTGWAGQVNLAPLTFAGIGAWIFWEVADVREWGTVPGIVAAAVVLVPVGALMALPALRLQGLYLALATLAFARMAELIFFTQPEVLGGGKSITVTRPEILGISFESGRAYLILVTAVFGAVGIGVVALRRSRFGRRLIALRNSEAASATVGVNLLETKVLVFSLSAAMAGFAGAFIAQNQQALQPGDFSMIANLPIVLGLVIGGISTVVGALFGGLFTVSLVIIKDALDISWLRALEILGPGLAGLGVIGAPAGQAVEIGADIRRAPYETGGRLIGLSASIPIAMALELPLLPGALLVITAMIATGWAFGAFVQRFGAPAPGPVEFDTTVEQFPEVGQLVRGVTATPQELLRIERSLGVADAIERIEGHRVNGNGRNGHGQDVVDLRTEGAVP